MYRQRHQPRDARQAATWRVVGDCVIPFDHPLHQQLHYAALFLRCQRFPHRIEFPQRCGHSSLFQREVISVVDRLLTRDQFFLRRTQTILHIGESRNCSFVSGTPVTRRCQPEKFSLIVTDVLRRQLIPFATLSVVP
ncbi:MAG: hypothetical protein WKF77_07990 [Planctomycetaceae bacterium]